jgi:8-oxo-dGTP pyrophosphatase MutT (NUDIX family)
MVRNPPKALLRTAGLVVLKDRKLLLAFSRNKQAWYLPGGKAKPGETAREALRREIREELNLELTPGELHFYTHITAPAFGEPDDTMMEQDCYRCDLSDKPLPGTEIEAVRYFDAASYLEEPRLVPGIILLLEHLKADRLLD